ncbi:MAG: TlpA family protein disulfide reductase [Brevinematia bacterium]
MRKLSIIFISILILLIQLTSYSKDTSKGKDYPTFIFKAKTVEGKNIDLKDYVGKKLIIVNFWATWCPPCRYEIPDLINLQENFKEDLLIVGIALDSNVEIVKKFMEKTKFNYPIVYDEYGINYLYGGISSIPTTFIINYEGKIVERMIGARSYDTFESLVKKYLKRQILKN